MAAQALRKILGASNPETRHLRQALRQVSDLNPGVLAALQPGRRVTRISELLRNDQWKEAVPRDSGLLLELLARAASPQVCIRIPWTRSFLSTQTPDSTVPRLL